MTPLKEKKYEMITTKLAMDMNIHTEWEKKLYIFKGHQI